MENTSLTKSILFLISCFTIFTGCKQEDAGLNTETAMFRTTSVDEADAGTDLEPDGGEFVEADAGLPPTEETPDAATLPEPDVALVVEETPDAGTAPEPDAATEPDAPVDEPDAAVTPDSGSRYGRCFIDHGGCSDLVECIDNINETTTSCAPCPEGYEGDGYTCTDVDECATHTDTLCVHPGQECRNVVGFYLCIDDA